jgi:hypothetical protein
MCIFNKVTDILPRAGEDIMTSKYSLPCFCGCSRISNMGRLYYNVPVSTKDLWEMVGGICDKLNIKRLG